MLHSTKKKKGFAFAALRQRDRVGYLSPPPWGQVRDLEATINAVPCDSVVIATPMDLRRVVNITKPAAVVRG